MNITDTTTHATAAIRGNGQNAAIGLYGTSVNATGTYGYSHARFGVLGETDSTDASLAATFGRGAGAMGVKGESNTATGVYGVCHASTCMGVKATNDVSGG